MTKTILYIHGKGGNAEEAKHYQPLFNGCNVTGFAERIGATLTVMKGGEHWFHTERQMNFLNQWIKDSMTKE